MLTARLEEGLIAHLTKDPAKLNENYVIVGKQILTRKGIADAIKNNTFLGERFVMDIVLLALDLLERKKEHTNTQFI
jgi:hypothetical protein